MSAGDVIRKLEEDVHMRRFAGHPVTHLLAAIKLIKAQSSELEKRNSDFHCDWCNP